MGIGRRDFPREVAFVAELAVVETPDRARIPHEAPLTLPRLVLVDVTQHERRALRTKQRTQAEFVVESCHRDTVFRLTTVHRAVRHSDRRDAYRSKCCIDPAGCSEEPHEGIREICRRRQRPDAQRQLCFVHRRKTGKDRFGLAAQMVLHFVLVEDRPTREPEVSIVESNLTDAVRNGHRIPRAHQREVVESPGRLVRERALQHQHRHRLRKSVHLSRE